MLQQLERGTTISVGLAISGIKVNENGRESNCYPPGGMGAHNLMNETAFCERPSHT